MCQHQDLEAARCEGLELWQGAPRDCPRGTPKIWFPLRGFQLLSHHSRWAGWIVCERTLPWDNQYISVTILQGAQVIIHWVINRHLYGVEGWEVHTDGLFSQRKDIHITGLTVINIWLLLYDSSSCKFQSRSRLHCALQRCFSAGNSLCSTQSEG